MTSAVRASQYTGDDLLNTLRSLPAWWFLLAEQLPDPTADLADLMSQQQAVADELAAAVGMSSSAAQLDMTGEQLWLTVMNVDVTQHRAAIEAAVDRSMALLRTASGRARELRAIHATGTVAGLFSSPGGLPKSAMLSADVGERGFACDRQATRRHHGRAWQALCLWSSERVAALRAEGHPIEPGFAGENISIAGIDWGRVLPGALVTIGEMSCEISLYALPCTQIAPWFTGRDFERVHHRRELGTSRLYASVVTPGTITVGDVVTLS